VLASLFKLNIKNKNEKEKLTSLGLQLVLEGPGVQVSKEAKEPTFWASIRPFLSSFRNFFV
jgi:hypothetical protein